MLLLASSFLIVPFKIKIIFIFIFITCCFCFVVAVVLGLGSIAVCSDNNHSFRGDNEQPVYYSSLTNVVHVYGKQNPEDQY